MPADVLCVASLVVRNLVGAFVFLSQFNRDVRRFRIVSFAMLDAQMQCRVSWT